MDIGAVLTKGQRERMALEVAQRAGSRIEQFDWASATVADDVIELHDDLGPYAELIRQLRGEGPIDDVQLLHASALEVRDDHRQGLEVECRNLEELLAGEWDYLEPDTPENRARIERQTRALIDKDSEVVALAESVLGAIDQPLAVAA